MGTKISHTQICTLYNAVLEICPSECVSAIRNDFERYLSGKVDARVALSDVAYHVQNGLDDEHGSWWESLYPPPDDD